MKQHILFIIMLSLVMILLPLHLRLTNGNTTLAGIEPYYHARSAIELTKGIPTEDTSIVNNRAYVPNPYHFVLALGYLAIGKTAFYALPLLFAFLTVILLYLILKKLRLPETVAPWTLIAYALSPPLIAIGTIGTPDSFVLTLLLAGTLFLLNTRWYLGTLCLIIVSLTGLVYNFAALVMLLFLICVTDKTKPLLTTGTISLAILALGLHPPRIPQTNAIIQYLSDIGGTYGFSIFALLLAIVGAVLIWQHKKTYYGAYLLSIAFLVFSFFYPGLLILANVLVSVLAGIALAKLSERKWKLAYLRHAALLVLFCGLLFSGISHAVSLSDTPPAPAFFKALQFPPTTVMTHEDYGFWVESAGHKAVIDPLWKELPEAEQQYWDATTLFTLTVLDRATPILQKYNITHIIITPEMQRGLLWEREDQGLDFLVKNSETFKKIETETHIAVWQTK